jgi:hypothetical protein
MSTEMPNIPLRCEAVGYWFFRLNGFLTTCNFVVHPERRGSQRTDADILGVRFPYREELLQSPMKDEEAFCRVRDKPLVVIVEIKTNAECQLNGPWTRREDDNVRRVLRAIGLLAPADVAAAASTLYQNGAFESPEYRISLVAVAARASEALRANYPAVPQFTWDGVLRFIYHRFDQYRRQKADHDQWDRTGHVLWDQYERSRRDGSRDDGFVDVVAKMLRITP